MWKLDKSTAEKTTKAAKCLLHSTSVPHVLADITCIILRKQRKGCFFRTDLRKDTDFPAQTEINLSEVLASSGGNDSPVGKKENISNTFIHFSKVEDQWDGRVKLV